MKHKEKILIDTDIGDDIDDFLALQMALNSPEVEVAGITTVFTRADLRAKLALETLKVNGAENIPVAVGFSSPMEGIWNDNLPCQYADNMKANGSGYPGEALDLLTGLTESHPGEVTILAIGPLTNIANAILKYEAFKKNVKQIVLMGGAYSYHYNEWNIVCDPESARIVFDSGIKITAVGLDVSMKCHITVQEAIEALQKNKSRRSEFMIEIIKRWDALKLNRPMFLHDPLAFAVIVGPSLVKTIERLVKVETKGQYTRGMTFCCETPFGEILPQNPNIRVCTDVDEKNFLKLFFQRVLLN